MPYRLPSLHLGTDFDRPVHPLPVPGVAQRGDSAALTFLDGASRGARRLSRLARRSALLGLQVEPPTGPVRVTVTVLVDDLSTAMWRSARRLEETEMPHELRHHRLLLVGAQGRPRAGLLLDRRRSDGDASVQRLSFLLDADEIGAAGLLSISFDVPDVVPPWMRPGLLEDGLDGICVGRVGVQPWSGQPDVRPSLSTGRMPVNRRHLVPRTPGGFLLGPGSGTGPVELRLVPRVRVPRPQPVGRRAMVKEPLARTRDAVLRTTRARAKAPLAVQVTPMDGSAVQVLPATPTGDGASTAVVDRSLLPAYVRPLPAAGGDDRLDTRLDWYVWVDDMDSERGVSG